MTENDWTDYYVSAMGAVPPFATALHEMAPSVERAYVEVRRWIVADREDGLTPAAKELQMMMLCIAADFHFGAIRHVRTARLVGATATQVAESLGQCYLMFGAMRFVQIGQDVWTASCAFDTENSAASDASEDA